MKPHTDFWFKMQTSLPFKKHLQACDAETFRMFILLQCALANQRTQTITEEEFIPYAPVRSWRVYARKLANAGLIVWDTETGTISVPTFSELNTGFADGKLSYTTQTRTVRKSAQLDADTEYEYDYDYVSPEWLDDVEQFLDAS